jgi:hypothetical protein
MGLYEQLPISLHEKTFNPTNAKYLVNYGSSPYPLNLGADALRRRDRK